MVSLRDHHEAIIDRELWDAVQLELQRRSRRGTPGTDNRYLFSGKIRCGECGAAFVSRPRVRKDGTICRRWSCRTAAAEGSRRPDRSGHEIGCAVGWTLRDEQAIDILQQTIGALEIDRDRLVRELTKILLSAVQAEQGGGPEGELSALREMVSRRAAAILDGQTDSEALFRTLLDHMTVRQGGRVEVHLRLLPQKWTFLLERRSGSQEEAGAL